MTCKKERELKQLVSGLRCYIYVAVFIVSCSRGNGEPRTQNLLAVNQAGYQPYECKLALIAISSQPADSFEVVEASTMEPVYKNEIQAGVEQDSATGDDIYLLDFTRLDKSGTYRLLIPGFDMQSGEFSIESSVYDEAFKTALESFYYQRCGTEIDKQIPWNHPVCHVKDAVFYENPKAEKKVAGGWHDAGDYGKYSVNTSVSLGFLLYLFDHQSHKFGDGNLDIPEAGNGLPDLLDEARWALDWLMKMQQEDGGVFHKIQKKKWTGEYLPHEDPDQRYIFEVSSTATADFAAVSALSARLFMKYDEEYSGILRKAGEKAWNFLERHPEIVPRKGFKNPSDVVGGEYGAQSDRDERLWAAIELFRLTGDPKYHNYFLNSYGEAGGSQAPPLSWKNVQQFAWSSYVRMDDRRQDQNVRKFLVQRITQQADTLVRRASRSGYRVVLEKDEYYWGSNSVALGYAFTLVQAFELTGKKLYKSTALDQLHYILGRNPFGHSFVTGIGRNAVKHPYHQFSNELDAERPVPGLVVGGPNNHSQLYDEPLSEYPGKAWEDKKVNYMVNEVAINYTAPFVYLTGYFSSESAGHSVSSN